MLRSKEKGKSKGKEQEKKNKKQPATKVLGQLLTLEEHVR